MNTAWKYIKIGTVWTAIAILGGLFFQDLYHMLPVDHAWKLPGSLLIVPTTIIVWLNQLIQKYYDLRSQEGLTREQRLEVQAISTIRIDRCWLWIAFLIFAIIALGLSALPWEEPIKSITLLVAGGGFFMALASFVFYPALQRELETFKAEVADQQKDIKRRQELVAEMKKASAEGLKGADIFDKYEQIHKPESKKSNKDS